MFPHIQHQQWAEPSRQGAVLQEREKTSALTACTEQYLTVSNHTHLVLGRDDLQGSLLVHTQPNVPRSEQCGGHLSELLFKG